MDVMHVEVEEGRYVKDGSWDSIHIVEVTEHSSTKASYKLTTTIILNMGVDRTSVGETVIAGSLTRQVICPQSSSYFLLTYIYISLFYFSFQSSSANATVNNDSHSHLANMGRMIEDMENDMRSNFNELYLMKTREIINSIRSNSE